jgi:hypothetical protein
VFRMSGMAEMCFIKNGQGPPVCGVHNMQLIECQTNEEKISRVGNFTFLKCPMSGQVPKQGATTQI